MNKFITSLFISIFIFITTATHATTPDISRLKKHFLSNLLSNGAVVASPSKAHPDYYYHWARDGAITMDMIATWYAKAPSTENYERLDNYTHWVERAQQTLGEHNKSFGEPKFYVDGRVYDKPWGRPQNDGPALRALTLIHFANALLSQNNLAYVNAHLYQASLDTNKMGVIKRDLEYTANHWMDKQFDLWEEAYGYHFFSSVVQRKALIEGAKLAKRLNDIDASNWYEKQAKQIERLLTAFVDVQNQIVSCSIDATGPVKYHDLDSATILAFNYLEKTDPLYAFFLPYIDNTAKALAAQFKQVYQINQQFDDAYLFGRYPGDTYDGYETDALGNPWFILTATMASFHFQKALNETGMKNAAREQDIEIGTRYLNHLMRFAIDNHLSEQINRDSGMMQGASDLTWSYQSLLKALLIKPRKALL